MSETRVSRGEPAALSIEVMSPADWGAVREIYGEGIATGDATFETDVPSEPDWDRAHLQACRLVARTDHRVIGWAALSRVSERPVYRGVAEVSVYVSAAARGHSIGSRLLHALIEASERAGVWTLQAGVFPENDASLRLHEACGFRRVGTRYRLGELRQQWRDVVLLERRSEVVGI